MSLSLIKAEWPYKNERSENLLRAWTAPPGFNLVTPMDDEDGVDWDAVVADDQLEIWLLRVPPEVRCVLAIILLSVLMLNCS